MSPFRNLNPSVCLFNVFTELPVAIYPVVPLCQSSGVRANWHSRCFTADRPIYSDSYRSQKKHLYQVEREEKQSYYRDVALIQHSTSWLCLLPSAAGDWCVQSPKEVIHATEEDIPLQTLQHLPSGSICSPMVQLSSGQVSVTFTMRPF